LRTKYRAYDIADRLGVEWFTCSSVKEFEELCKYFDSKEERQRTFYYWTSGYAYNFLAGQYMKSGYSPLSKAITALNFFRRIKDELRGHYLIKSFSDSMKFLEVLEYLGYKWCSGRKPTEYKPPIEECVLVLRGREVGWGTSKSPNDVNALTSQLYLQHYKKLEKDTTNPTKKEENSLSVHECPVIEHRKSYYIENKKDLNVFLTVCYNIGVRWSGGEEAIDFEPNKLPCVITRDNDVIRWTSDLKKHPNQVEFREELPKPKVTRGPTAYDSSVWAYPSNGTKTQTNQQAIQQTTKSNKKGVIMTKLGAVVDTNKEAHLVASKITLGKVAINKMQKIAASKAPFGFGGAVQHPLFGIILANVVNYAVKERLPHNHRALEVADSMMLASAVITQEHFDVEAFINDFLDDIVPEAPKSAKRGKAKAEAVPPVK